MSSDHADIVFLSATWVWGERISQLWGGSNALNSIIFTRFLWLHAMHVLMYYLLRFILNPFLGPCTEVLKAMFLFWTRHVVSPKLGDTKRTLNFNPYYGSNWKAGDRIQLKRMSTYSQDLLIQCNFYDTESFWFQLMWSSSFRRLYQMYEYHMCVMVFQIYFERFLSSSKQMFITK